MGTPPPTPGPWFQSHRKTASGYSTEVYDVAGETIATLPVKMPGGITATAQEANATLMSASPDLLAVLKAMVGEIRKRHQTFDARIFVDAERAIAKAEGDAS